MKRAAFALLSCCIYIAILLAFANGDQIQEEAFSKYSEMGTEEQCRAIEQAVIYEGGKEKEVTDELKYMEWYSFIGMNFSNNSSEYEKTGEGEGPADAPPSDLCIDFQFREAQVFTFYNNPDLRIGPSEHLRYDLDNGDFYSSDADGKSYDKYQCRDREHPFSIDEELYKEIANY